MISTRGYFSTPPVVRNLLIVNVLVFIAQMLPSGVGDTLTAYGALHFWKGGMFRVYQLVSYMFLHGGFTHLFFNMFALWMFGRILEYDLGSRKFFVYYMICGIGAGLMQLGVNWIEFSNALSSGMNGYSLQLYASASTIGASGAIFGVLLAYGMIHPNNIIMLMIPPIPIKAKYFVIGYGVLELLAGVSGTGGSVAHFAHIGGMLWGFLLLKYWRKRGELYY